MKAGLIGNGNHSKRIQKILKRKNINFFLYKPSRPNYYNIEDFEISSGTPSSTGSGREKGKFYTFYTSVELITETE